MSRLLIVFLIIFSSFSKEVTALPNIEDQEPNNLIPRFRALALDQRNAPINPNRNNQNDDRARPPQLRRENAYGPGHGPAPEGFLREAGH